jgi:uroporphyrinogen-III synthase
LLRRSGKKDRDSMLKFKVLSTKQLDPSLAEQAREKNIELSQVEFISVRPIVSEQKLKEVQSWGMAGAQCVVFTSAHAVKIVDELLHPHDTVLVTEWKIFCLSGRTRQAVMNAQVLKHEITAESVNATSLAEKIVANEVKEIVFFCGNRRRDELPDLLKKHGLIVHEVIVYETIEQPVIVTEEFDAVIFFSPSAVESFFSCNHLPAQTVCVAIGETTAKAIATYATNKVITSAAPEQEAVLNTAFKYLNKV